MISLQLHMEADVKRHNTNTNLYKLNEQNLIETNEDFKLLQAICLLCGKFI